MPIVAVIHTFKSYIIKFKNMLKEMGFRTIITGKKFQVLSVKYLPEEYMLRL